ncbi:MAG: molybdopterin-dependent oxidoreductase [Planctomycetes bacterium]|nr:molybdopterin-dependent oxidoreductase [Planctomycetota bacterium]
MITRRTFLKLGIGGGSGIALMNVSKLVPGGIQTLDMIDEHTIHRDLPEQLCLSVCSSCSTTCKILLRNVGGNIVGVRPFKDKPCARAYTTPQELYHPDRVKVPLKRSGGRGGGMWNQIDKNGAIAELANILRTSGAKTVFILREDSALSFGLLKAVGAAAGSPYIFTYDVPLEHGPDDALEQLTGWSSWKTDLLNADGVVSFGWNWLQNFTDLAGAQKAFSKFREKDSTMIYIGPRLNVTAMKSRKWIACKPGFESLVALAVSSVILRDGKYDKLACDKSEGFTDFAAKLQNFDLQWCEKISGVSPKQVKKLADLLADARPICICDRGRLVDQQSVVMLNALLGNIGRAGGFVQLPDVTLPFKKEPKKGLFASDVPDILNKKEIETVIFVGVNPLFTGPDPLKWRASLSNAKNVVSITSLMNETTGYADLVIPLALPAERKDIYFEIQDNNEIKTLVVEPAVKPQPEILSPAEITFEISNKLDAEDFPWKKLEDVVGSLVVRNPDKLALRFSSEWKSPEFSNGEFHLLLELPGTFSHLEGAHLPYLLTTVGPHLRKWWSTWVEMNPSTAERLELHNNDTVLVENISGSIQAKVRIFEGISPDAVCIPLGMGHSIGHFAQKEGGNPSELIGYIKDEKCGVSQWNLQKVNLRKVAV